MWLDSALLRLYFTPIPKARRKEPSCYQIGNSKSGLWLGLFLQTNKPTVGEARQSGSSADVAEVALSSRWASIFWIIAGSSILAMILTSPPHSLQVSTSILNTRFKRWAHVMAALCSAGVRSSSGVPGLLTLPRFAGVIWTRYLLFGANTPWKRGRFTLGLGTKTTSLEMKSSGSNMTCVVPLRQGVFHFWEKK